MTEPENDDGEHTTPPKPPYHVNFATISALVAVLIGVWVVLAGHLFSGSFGLDDRTWRSLSGGGQLAARLMAPVSVLGVVLILAGAWMAIVEWRGGFADKAPDAAKPTVKTLGLPDIPAVIGAVGKLRGAALLIVVGALLMVLSAWVAQSVSSDSHRQREPQRPMQMRMHVPEPDGSMTPLPLMPPRRTGH